MCQRKNIYITKAHNNPVDKANNKNEYGPIADCNDGKVIPTKKFPVQLKREPKAMAEGRGPTSKSSENNDNLD